MQTADRLLYIFLVDHKAHVDLGRTLRDHAQVDVAKRAEDLSRNAILTADVLSNHTDQRLSPLVLYIGELA